MNEAKHTPGPWTACFTTLDREIQDFHISGSRDGSALPVCDARGAGFAPELEANAHLISAAPEMLAALKEFTDHYPTGVNPNLDHAYVLGRRAIARAEGRTP